jgi:hypothetical protein
MSKSNYCALNKVYLAWIKLNGHLEQYSKPELGPFWRDIYDYFHRIGSGGWRDRIEK